MIFDVPKPEDLNFEFSLENTGCMFTVRKYREFNDESAKRLFPRSSADYVPSDTYTLPDSYFCESFWTSEKQRLQRLLNVWNSNKNKLAAAISSEEADDFKLENCMAGVAALINMCEWLLSMCWEGDRSRPPMPLYLYKARLSELKEANSLGIQCLHELSCDEKLVAKIENDLKITDTSSAPQKPRAVDGGSSNFLFEYNKRAPHWRVTFLERIGEILTTLDKLANAGEDVEDALTFAVEVRRSIKEGKSCLEDLSTKLKFLDETVVLLEKTATERVAAIKNKDNTKTVTLNTPSSTSDTDNYSNRTAQLSNSGRRSTVAKRGRKSTKLAEDHDYVEKRRNTGWVLGDADDDLVSRVKRGQRTRRPTRTFTPLWTLSPSPPPAPKTTFSNKATSSVSKGPSVAVKRITTPSTSLTPTILSPDSGRPSSNESTVNATAPTNEKQLSKAAPNKEVATTAEKSTITMPVQSLPSDAFSLASSTSLTATTSVLPTIASSVSFSTPSLSTVASSASFSTPVPSLSAAWALQPPPLNLDEQSLLALWKEKVQLCDVRTTLLSMLRTDGISQYHFVPLVIETIDKATAALDNKDMIAYAMHRAAIDVGCAEIGNIMFSYNKVDPSTQIAALATAMGLNPAPFTSMVQSSAMTTGLSSSLLADLHEAANVVSAREVLTGSYSLPAQSVDSFQGYTERDISKYLL